MNDESKVFGVSVRAFVCILLTMCVCCMALTRMEVKEPIYSAFLIALGFYYGQKKQGGTNEKV
jgi:hypothetical protein